MKSTKDRSNQRYIIMLVLYLLFSVTLVVAAGREIEDPADKNQKQEWDVMNPPGEFEVVEINTDEGTWMDIDVSPSGDEIVFDLLGDIYTLPIAGGKANPLSIMIVEYLFYPVSQVTPVKPVNMISVVEISDRRSVSKVNGLVVIIRYVGNRISLFIV